MSAAYTDINLQIYYCDSDYTQIDVEFSNSAIVDRKAGYEVTEDDGTVLTADDNLTLENCIQLYASPEATEQANTKLVSILCEFD